MGAERHAKLFRDGLTPAVGIPVEFQVPGGGAVIRQAGDRLVIEAVGQADLSERLARIGPWDRRVGNGLEAA